MTPNSNLSSDGDMVMHGSFASLCPPLWMPMLAMFYFYPIPSDAAGELDHPANALLQYASELNKSFLQVGNLKSRKRVGQNLLFHSVWIKNDGTLNLTVSTFCSHKF